MNLLRSLLPLCLLLPEALLAQTASTSASTVVFSKPSTAATYTASHAGATLVKAESNQLTFRNADHSFTLVSGSGVAYQQPSGVWAPSQLQVATLNDGTGWNISGVPMPVSLAGSQGQVKVLSIKLGSVTTSFQLPQLSYNGDDTFAFQENGTTWLLRVSEAAVDIEATVAKRTGRMAHTLGYNSLGAALSVDNNGALHIGGAVHITHPLIVGANRKYYDVCSPWSATSSGVSFTCDDTKLPDAALPYVIDPTFNSGPTSYDSTYFVWADEGCCGTTEYTDNVTWNAYFNISSIPSNAFVQSASVGGASYQWFENYNSQATPACNYAGDGWTTNLGGGIAGASTLTYTMNFQMGWWNNDYLYECTGSVNPALLAATITYTSQEVYTIPNMTGSVSANTGSSVTFNVPGGVQYSSWGNPESFYFNFGDGYASGWVASSASHTYSSPGTYQVTFQVESSASAPNSAANAWTVTVTGAAASYQGWLDVASCSTIAGWAENASQINSAVTVNFYVDGASSFSATANQFRQDLLNAGIGTGYYGFSFATPAVLLDGYTHSVSARYGTTGTQLLGSPKSVQCGTPQTATITTYPAGLSVNVAGTPMSCNPSCSVSASSTIAVASPQSLPGGPAGTQYVFAGWSDGGGNPRTITAGSTVTANFNAQYYFTATVNPLGSGTIAPASGWYSPGASFWATATPSVRYQLSSFSPGGAVPSYDVVMNGAVTLTANFVPFTGQTIASNPPGASFTVDGAPCTACTFQWTPGTQHTITTTSPQSQGTGAQLAFVSWSDGTNGSSDTITAAAGTTYTESFAAQYYLTTAVNPNGAGNISPSSGWYSPGVTLSASAIGGYQFTNFTGTATGGSPLSITMTGPTSETANFAPTGGFTLTATPSDQTVAAGGVAAYTITPTPSSGFSGQIALSGSCDSDVVPVISPASISGTGSSIVTLTSPSGDSFDFTTCTITGTSGSQVVRAPIILRLYVQVTIAVNPSGVALTASVDGGPPSGITAVAPFRTLWKVGSTHTISVTSPQTGTDGQHYAFSGWSDGGAASHQVTATHGVTTYTATLTPQYTVSGQVTLGGAGLQGVTVALNPSAGGVGVATTTDANGNYSLGGTAGVSYTVAPSFMNYTFSQPFSTGALNTSLTGVSFAVTGGSGSTGGAATGDPDLPAPGVTLPAAQSYTYQNCSDITGTWDDPNLVDQSQQNGTWSLLQANDDSVTGNLTTKLCGPLNFSVSGSITSGGFANLTATPPASQVFCGGQGYNLPTVYLSATVGCSAATPSSESWSYQPTGNVYAHLASLNFRGKA